MRRSINTMSAHGKISENTNTAWWGPPFVALGAALWGIETLFRVNLQKHFSSDVLVFFEHVLGVLILIPLALVSIRKFKEISKRSFRWILVSAIVGSALGTVCFTASLKLVNISVANVLLNLQPVWSVFLAWLVLRERIAPGFAKWSALAIASGVMISVNTADFSQFQIESKLGLMFVFATILCWGTATVAGRALMMEMPLSVAAVLRFAFGALGTLAIVLVNGNGPTMVQQIPLLYELPILKEYLWLLLAAGLTPLFFYFYGLRYTSAMAGAFCEMAQTLAALAVTWGVMGQALLPHQVLAALILVLAVTRINLLQAGSVTS